MFVFDLLGLFGFAFGFVAFVLDWCLLVYVCDCFGCFGD